MKNPDKNIPRAIHSSMAIVVVRYLESRYQSSYWFRVQVLFLLANVSYFIVLDQVAKIWLSTKALETI